MRIVGLIFLIFFWIMGFVFLVLAFTDVYPNNPFQDYQLLIALGFIFISWLGQRVIQRKLKPVDRKDH